MIEKGLFRMDWKKEVLNDVIYCGDWDTIRGLLAALPPRNPFVNINPEDFTEVSLWSDGEDIYELAYSDIAMVLYKNRKLFGVAELDPVALGDKEALISKFSLGDGALGLMHGML